MGESNSREIDARAVKGYRGQSPLLKFQEKLCIKDAQLRNFATIYIGQELSVKPFSLLSTKPRKARSAYGGPKGRPAGDERHRQK